MFEFGSDVEKYGFYIIAGYFVFRIIEGMVMAWSIL